MWFFRKPHNALVRWAIGIVLIIIGIAGLFLPFIQGIACILLGLSFMNEHVSSFIHTQLHILHEQLKKWWYRS